MYSARMTDISSYRDDEPEDAWDADDTRQDHIFNLIRRLILLDSMIIDQDEMLDQIEVRVLQHQRRPHLTEREKLRITQLLEDITTTRAQT